MSSIIKLTSFADQRGNLTVLDHPNIPFFAKRIFFIHSVPSPEIRRGGHRHHKTRQVLICLKGSCTVKCDDGKKQQTYRLDSCEKGLLLEPEDFHWMDSFSHDAILLVLASEQYDSLDYIHQGY